MEDIFVRYIALPPKIKGLTVQDSKGNYNIYLNSRLTYEANLETLQHELDHVAENDFSSHQHINFIENKNEKWRGV
jgi:hypothetical protein